MPKSIARKIWQNIVITIFSHRYAILHSIANSAFDWSIICIYLIREEILAGRNFWGGKFPGKYHNLTAYFNKSHEINFFHSLIYWCIVLMILSQYITESYLKVYFSARKKTNFVKYCSTAKLNSLNLSKLLWPRN